jgi:hypothetical protein
MSPTVVLEWMFSPADYFEAPIEISQDDYTIIIADGKAEAKIDSAIYQSKPSMRNELHDELNARFLAEMLFSHREYHLFSSMTCIHPDGRKDQVMKCEPCNFKVTGHTINFQKCDKNGNTVLDTKRDRIDKRNNISGLVSRYLANDDVLKSLFKSWKAAVKDPDNELVHLYEIRDALHRKFGNNKSALSTLEKFGLTRNDWKDFGNLANKASLRQGRHRGKSDGALRDATDDELFMARRIAGTMIEAYLRHIDATADSSRSEMTAK